MKKVGFIGLGKMGLPMALNLIKAGFKVYVASGNMDSRAKMNEAGAFILNGFNEMFKECEVIITVVPADKEIIEIYLGENGVAACGNKGLICIDMTSAKGITKKEIGSVLKEKGIIYIDAPVSGGVAGATDGTLTIMAGCEKQEFEEHKMIFEAMGKKIFYTGEVGTASNVKMLNQMLNAGNTAIAAEVLCLSRELGIEDSVLSDVVNQSSGASFVFERNVPKFMMTGNHTPGFRLDLMKKDVGLFIDTAKAVDEFTPISQLVYQIYQAASNSGLGDVNYTGIHKWYENN